MGFLSLLLVSSIGLGALEVTASPPALAGSRHRLVHPRPTIVTAIADHEADLGAPEPTRLPLTREERDELWRRDTTSSAEASVCGYFNGDKNSRLACGWNWNCVFHSSNADYPALVGCCPISSTTQCQFLTTCYGQAQISATPSLQSLTTDPFVTLCTQEDNVYCHTWTWPDLSMTDYGCTYVSSPAVESIQTVGSLTDVTDDDDQITETLSISWVDDSVVRAMLAVTTTTGTTTTGTTPATSATSTSTGRPDDSGEGDGTSTPVGAIVGGVVGGVVGVGAIIAAVIIYRLRQKRAATAINDPGPAPLAGPPAGPPGDIELHGKNEWHEADSRPVYAELPARGPRHELE